MISGILTLAVTAQTITITFNGTNRARNYQVLLDGTSYYSNSAIDPNNTNASVNKEIILTNQQLGSHTIEIYRIRNNNTVNNNGTNTTPYGKSIYTKTFELRRGYDMDISVNGMGNVTFTEKRTRNQGRRGNYQTVTPMNDADYNHLVQVVRGRFLQNSKVAAERDAFINTANYFSTAQVRQLLLLISSESNRLALAKLAYPRVTDPSIFTELYDVFNTIASRNEMNAFIRNNPNYNNTRGNNNNNNNNNNSGYRTPMADYQFSQLLQTVNSQYNQSAKYTTIAGSFNNSANYFSTAQIRQLLSIINAEADRLALAKLSYARASDPTNFTSLYDLFYNQNSRNELDNLISGNTTTGNKTAMADYQFNQLLQTVNSQYNQSSKYTTIAGAFNNTANYFSTAQIRQLLSIINAEVDRLALAKLSYARTSDPSNFTSLYDLFYNQNSRNELNNFISGNTTGYKTAMTDYQFNQLLQTLNNQYNQSGKYATVSGAFNNSANYFTTYQVRQLLSVINAESDKLALAKQSYLRVTDPANFSTLYDLFYTQSSRNELNAYVIQNGGTSTYNNPQYPSRTPMSDAAFTQVLQKVSNHFLPWDKVRDAKAAFNTTSYYFTTSQIRQILTVILSETDRLELAKLAWSRVTDPTNFTQLYDLFTSQANKDDLNSYIQSHPF
jgi:hypothetical protein